MAEGQVRPVLAGDPHGARPLPWRPRPHQGQSRHAGHDEDAKNHYRRSRPGICRVILEKGNRMTKVRVNSFSISIDGYGAGPGQALEHPLGVGGMQLHEWVLPTRTFQTMFGKEGGTSGIDDDFAARSMEGLGAWILGRNMF